jgi:hypothetical protein
MDKKTTQKTRSKAFPANVSIRHTETDCSIPRIKNPTSKNSGAALNQPWS